LARRPARDFLALGFFSFSNLIVASVREAPADDFRNQRVESD
jgi:hypothetical protein